MSQYLLSVHSVEGAPSEPPTPEEMQAFMENVNALEAEMKESGSFVFGGALHDPDAATVVRRHESELVMTGGPFVESKEHIGGFYVINAEDLDEALGLGRQGRGCDPRPDRSPPVSRREPLRTKTRLVAAHAGATEVE